MWTARTSLPKYFYPRPPRGGRLKPTQLMSLQNQISIHALREEGDRLAAWQTCFQQDFYPRPPRGGRPQMSPACPSISYFYPRPPRGGRPATTSLTSTHKGISIHALREEGDRYPTVSNMIQVDFYPRPPRGGRREGPSACVCVLEFLSTPSARRATWV